MVTKAVLPRRLRVVATVSVSVLLALAATGCFGGDDGADGTSATSASGKPVDGGVLRVGITESSLPPSSLNPYRGINTWDIQAYTMVYPTLIQFDAKGNAVGAWAESWEVSDDGRTYTFSLKPGKWSDGRPLTAQDAVFTIDLVRRYAGGPTALQELYVEGIEDAEAPDPQTLVIRYRKPQPEGIVTTNLNVLFMLPKHVWAKHAGNGGKDLKDFSPEAKLPLVAGGPFRVTKFEPKGTTIFEPNPGYYEEKPHVDAIGLQVFQNTEGVTRALQSGNLDLAPDATEVATAVKGNSRLRQLKAPSSFTYFVDFNSNPKKREDPELDNVKVREAISLAIDRERIIEVEFNGLAKPAASFVNPTAAEWIPDDIEPGSYDPARANEILDGLGYERGKDGIRVTDDGHRMEYDFTLWENTRMNEIIVQNLGQIGIRLKTELIQGPAWNTAIAAPDGKFLKSDLSITTWSFLYDPSLLNIYTCGAWGGSNLTGYCNKEYDRLNQAQRVETDEERRKELVAEMQRILLREDRVTIPLVYPDDVSVVTAGWGGIEPAAFGPDRWASVHRVKD